MSLLMKPYFIRAIYEWCLDYGYDPYLEITVEKSVQIPALYTQEKKIIFNIGTEAVNQLVLGNETIKFQARFNGILEFISIPISSVNSIYSKNTGEGINFNFQKFNLEVDSKSLLQKPERNKKMTENVNLRKTSKSNLFIVK